MPTFRAPEQYPSQSATYETLELNYLRVLLNQLKRDLSMPMRHYASVWASRVICHDVNVQVRKWLHNRALFEHLQRPSPWLEGGSLCDEILPRM